VRDNVKYFKFYKLIYWLWHKNYDYQMKLNSKLKQTICSKN